MTNYPASSAPPGAMTPGSSPSHATGTPDATTSKKGKAKKTAERASDAAHDVAGSAKHEAGSVVNEATDQVKKLASQTRDELADQASSQQRRVADGLHSVGSELSSMSAASETNGVASGIVSTVGHRVDDVADWLEHREPSDVLREVSDFARARPAVFIGIAAVVGILAGRLTRSLTADNDDDASPSTHQSSA